jgi:xanthine dehydrogenase accessory factor
MKVWGHIVKALEAHGTCAMVSVVGVEGSAPREIGARIVVTPLGFHGSIGGGTLEWHAIAKAQALLGKPTTQKLSSHSLGPELGQCCGGRVQLVTEAFASNDLATARHYAAQENEGVFAVTGRISVGEFTERFGDSNRRLYLFGAGHVGRALVLALAPLPFVVTWIDPRADAFPTVAPANVTALCVPDPAAELANARAHSFALVMTHDHGLDLAIIDTALRNSNIVFAGLIGSATKRARFSKRLQEAGVSAEKISALACPIGIAGIKSKHPAAIAAATVAQLLEKDELLRTSAIPVATVFNPVKLGTGRGVA